MSDVSTRPPGVTVTNRPISLSVQIVNVTLAVEVVSPLARNVTAPFVISMLPAAGSICRTSELSAVRVADMESFWADAVIRAPLLIASLREKLSKPTMEFVVETTLLLSMMRPNWGTANPAITAIKAMTIINSMSVNPLSSRITDAHPQLSIVQSILTT